MPHHWIYNSDPEVVLRMLKEIGIESIDELFRDIPENLKLKRDLNVGFGKQLSECELYRLLRDKYAKRISPTVTPPFAGIEMCYHYVPAIVKEFMLRGEFYTAYTPYQPEINQGILQALFEYQSLMAELYGIDVVNASMYDGSTALAEAVRLALRVRKGRKRVLVSKGVSPIKRIVLSTWLRGIDVKIDYIPLSSDFGTTIIQDSNVLEDVAAIIIENPTYLGSIELNLRELIEEAHKRNVLVIVYSNPISLGILKPPGDLGADIVVGEGQPLGLGLYYGGSTLGILGVRRDLELIRQLPGRLVGMTITIDKQDRGFALVLQTREQHIRRERATSNITTNSALMAILAAIYTSWLGGDGIKKLARSIAARTLYALEKLSKVLPKNVVQIPLFSKAKYFMKIPLKFNGIKYSELRIRMRRRGILCSEDIGKYDPENSNTTVLCFTEVHSRNDIDTLVDVLRDEIQSLVGGV